MNNAKLLGAGVAGLMLMLGAGCASSTAPVANTPAPAPVPVVEAPKVPVPFSTVQSDLFGLEGKYSELTFSNGAGTCLTKLPYTALSYSPTSAGPNFMLKDAGVMIDDRSSSNTGSVLFDGKTVAGDKVDCKLMIPYGKDTATLTCADAKEKEVCSSTYSIMALPL